MRQKYSTPLPDSHVSAKSQPRRRNLSHGLFALWLLLLVTSNLFGQAVTSLRGTVTDPSGAVIPGAGIKLISAITGAIRAGVTDASGAYQFQQLQPGIYALEVDAPSFGPIRKENIELQVALPATVNIVMRVGSTSQAVEVTTEAQTTINTTDATLGNVLNSQQVSTLPIQGRNVVDLLSLQPGVTFLGRSDGSSSGTSGGNTSSDSRSGAVNGARSDQSNVTLDGVDVNDENYGYAFDSVLRMTQDSVAEFRVTTSNPNAEAGRSSGAQITLITKSGTNRLHGSVYEYNRNASFTANDWFNKRTQLANGQSNRPPALVRNIFGAAIGGPIKRDKLFFFLNYEGRRDSQGADVGPRNVPTASLRQGIVQYVAKGGQAQTLTPAQIKNMDPQHVGVNQAVLATLNSYPLPNDLSVGDGLNFSGFRFVNTVRRSYNTYIGRLDWTITPNHTLFWRGNLVNDSEPGTPQFPGQPASTRALTNSKGFALGYTAVLRANLVNNFRWGLTRQGSSTSGISNQPSVGLAGVDLPTAFSRTSSYIIPVHNLVDDLSWIKDRHSFQFGANIRIIDDQLASTGNSFPSAGTTIGWLLPSGIANRGVPLDPAAAGYPAVATSYASYYNNAIADAVGLVTEGNAVYNYDKTGNALPLGVPVKRDYRWSEYELYAQDSWKVRPDLTLTFGLRYSLLQPPTETSGTQVSTCVLTSNACTPFSLTEFYNQSARQGVTGGTASKVPNLSFDLNGRSNGRADFWNWDKSDIAPRFAFAWAPHANEGMWRSIFGQQGKTSIRGGYTLVYDHFGAGIVNNYDTTGSYGLTSKISNPPGVLTTTTAPRYQGVTSFPSGLLPSAPAGGFPATPDPEGFNISWGLDSKIKTPYSHLFDLSIQREIGSNTFEISYVGRIAHRLMEQMDVAMPLNLSGNGSDYFAAAADLSKMANANVPVTAVQHIPYWQTLFGALEGKDIGNGTLTATQNVYALFQQNLGNETAALNLLDEPSGGLGAGTLYPAYRFFHSQYSALYGWRSIGMSYYNALQVVLQHHSSHGLQAGLNYTYSRAIDWNSQAERLGNSGSVNNAQIINTWVPDQLRGRADFNMTHQINGNYLWDLPVGRGKTFLGGTNRIVDALIGGWQTTGIVRWTSGLPFGVDDGSNWPTNWDIEGFATLSSKIPAAALKRGKGAQRFADPGAVFNSFRLAYPGESGTRNPLLGDGYFSWDTGLNKAFTLTERLKLQLRGEAFNVTNSVRFDPHSVSANMNQPASFGNASSTLTQSRVLQVAGRIEF
ncbi:carboxypeptidase regulatory-like domain-containing protein [Terriglobus sp. 2YAB30_2]|uniref:carboxypeptidase-like regulatory domain-containing protein n=1 Tax=Terriglobus sp. 2YAB30_2 TaxID=3233023 RepID=UPI003F96A098